MEREEGEVDNASFNLPGIEQSTGFLPNRFPKINNFNIPDTIEEQLHIQSDSSRQSLDMENQYSRSDSLTGDQAEICSSPCSKTNESKIRAIEGIDYSFIINSEKKLLEKSLNKSHSSIGASNEDISFNKLNGSSELNDTLSTPRCQLRKENSMLRSEIDEAYKFHDLEYQISEETWSKRYAELEELYTILKNEYDEYREKQDSIHCKIAETVCSELEPLNKSSEISESVFVSFSTENESSALFTDLSENEATLMNDISLLNKDPLSITQNSTIRSPLSSSSRLSVFGSSSKKKTPMMKQVNNVKDLHTETEVQIQLLNSKVALDEKDKKIENLEEKLLKNEDAFLLLSTEHERLTLEFVEQTKTLKENLECKTKQLESLTESLATEIISLDPSLKDTIVDQPATKLLALFIKTIIESCQSLQNNMSNKFKSEKSEWESKSKENAKKIEELESNIESLKEQLKNQESSEFKLDELTKLCEDMKKQISDSETVISIQKEEIENFKNRETDFRKTQEEILATTETIAKLESQILETEAEKKELEKIVQDLQEETAVLKKNFDEKMTRIEELEKDVCSYLNKNGELEQVICGLKSDLELANHDKKYLELQLQNEIKENKDKDLKIEELEKENELLKSDDAEEKIASFKETLKSLESQLTRNESEKKEAEFQSQILKENISKLKSEIETKSLVIRELEESVSFYLRQGLVDLRQYEELQQAIMSSEEEIYRMKIELEKSKSSDKKVKELEVQLKSAKDDIERTEVLLKDKLEEISEITERLNVLLENKKTLSLVLSEVQECLQVPCDTVERLLAGSLENRKIFSEKINELVQFQVRSIEGDNQMSNDFALAKERIIKMENKVNEIESARKETEIRCKELEESKAALEGAIETKNNKIEDLEKCVSSFEKDKKEITEKAENEIANLKTKIETLESKLETLKNEQGAKDSLLKSLYEEIELFKREKEMDIVTLEKLKENEKNLCDVLSEVQNCLGVSDTKVYADYESRKLLIEKINSLVKFQAERTEYENKIKIELASANEEITRLELKLSEATAEIIEIKKVASDREIQNKEFEEIVKKSEELKIELEESKTCVKELKKELQDTKEEQMKNDLLLENLKKEIDLIKIEKDKLDGVSSEIKTLENKVELLVDILTEIQCEFDLPDNTITKMLSGENRKVFIEQIDALRKSKAESLERENKIRENLASLLETKTQLESQLAEMENAENEIEIQSKKLAETLQSEIDSNKILLVTYASEIEALKKTVQELENNLSHLKTTLENSEKENRDKDVKVEEMEKKINLHEVSLEQRDVLDNKLLDVLAVKINSIHTDKSNIFDVLLELQSCLKDFDLKTAKQLSNFVETIAEAISEIQNDLKKKLELERGVLEETRLTDAAKIQNLLKDVESLENQLTRQKSEFAEINELQKLCQELKNQLSEKEDKVLIQNDEINDLRKRESENANDLVFAKETITKLESQLTEVETAKNEVLTKCLSLEETSLVLRDEVKTRESEIKKAVEELSTATEKISKLEEQLLEVKAEKEEVGAKCQTLVERSVSLTEEIETLQMRESEIKKTLEENVKTLEEQLSEIKAEKEAVVTKCVSLEESSLVLREEIMTRESETKKAIEELAIATEKISKLETQLLDIETLQKSESEIKNTLEENVKILQGQLSEIRAEKEEFVSKFLDLEKTSKSLAEEIQARESENKKTLEDLLAATESVKTLRSQLSAVESEKEKFEVKCLDLEKASIALTEEIKTLQIRESENGKVLENFASATDTIAKLQTQLSEVQKEKQEFGEKCRNLEKTSVSLGEEIKSLQAEHKRVVQELDTARDSIIKLQSQMLETENEKENAVAKCVQLEETSAALKEEIKALQVCESENKKILEELAVGRDIITKLQSQLLETENEKEEAVAKCAQLEKTSAALKEEIKALQVRESENKRTVEELVSATETIEKLKWQLSEVEVLKDDAVSKYVNLEKTSTNLTTEIESKKVLVLELEKSVSLYSNENKELKRTIQQTEEIICNLKAELEVTKRGEKKVIDDLKADLKLVKEEKNNEQLKVEELLKENDLLKTAKADVEILNEKVKALEENKDALAYIISDVQSCLKMPGDISEFLSGKHKNRNIFSKNIKSFIKSQTESLITENQSLKLGNENLKEKVKELNRIIGETNMKDNATPKQSSKTLRNRSGRSQDLCNRQLEKLEEMNHDLTMLLGRILVMTKYPDVEKIKFLSLREYPNISKQVLAHFENLEAQMKALKETNESLDEECESYAATIKDLKKEATLVWKSNKVKVEELEKEISKLKKERSSWEKEKEDFLAKISKLDAECQKLRSESNFEGVHSCRCAIELKKFSEMKRSLLIKEQKILELEDFRNQNKIYETEIKYLKNIIEREKKTVSIEKDKSRKLQNEIAELNQKLGSKKSGETEFLDELRSIGISGGVAQDTTDKERVRKLTKDIAFLKELCRARYEEMKRKDAEIASLKNGTPKKFAQINSPIRTRSSSLRSKSPLKDIRNLEASAKENILLK